MEGAPDEAAAVEEVTQYPNDEAWKRSLDRVVPCVVVLK
jgi:hypothetical protein